MVANALRLANGRLSIAIVLLEPSVDGGSYENMIRQSPTLREVNNLIREASNGRGRYSLEDATILDVRVLLSLGTRANLSLRDDVLEAAYDVFQEVMEIKRPDIILTLQCQTSTVRNSFARRVSSRARATSGLKTLCIKNHKAVLVRGFHPSTYLRYKSDEVAQRQLRERLLGHFEVAFATLDGQKIQT